MKKRRYKQNCALAQAADLIGERWTLLIIRGLLLGPKRYGELLSELQGMGTNLLATRLKEMQADGLIAKQLDGRSPYALTDIGRDLEPVVMGLIRWSLQSFPPRSEPEYLHKPDWDLLALKSMFKVEQAPKAPLTVQFEWQGWASWVTVSKQAYQFGLGACDKKVDLHIHSSISGLFTTAEFDTQLSDQQQHLLGQFIACFNDNGVILSGIKKEAKA